uniref:hypothetical protein n=1 Tax=Microbulbifer agarilyticus TaxID=260552 RepID=UPI001110ECEA|nr:hypothetical protein [Microbulbifer agarilyticus]
MKAVSSKSIVFFMASLGICLVAYISVFDPRRLSEKLAHNSVMEFEQINAESLSKYSRANGWLTLTDAKRETLISWGEKQGSFEEIEKTKLIEFHKSRQIGFGPSDRLYIYRVDTRYTRAFLSFFVSVSGTGNDLKVTDISIRPKRSM